MKTLAKYIIAIVALLVVSFYALPKYSGFDPFQLFNAKNNPTELQQGVQWLLQLDLDSAIAKSKDGYIGELRRLLREHRVRYRQIERGSGVGVEVKFSDPSQIESARKAITQLYPYALFSVERRRDAGDFLVVKPSDQMLSREMAVQQNVITLRKRLRELGVAPFVVKPQGEQIVVQVPPRSDIQRVKQVLTSTATLEFHLVDESVSIEEAQRGVLPAGARLYRQRDQRPLLLRNRVLLGGESIVDAKSGVDRFSGGPAIFITLDGKGAARFAQETEKNIKRLMAVVFIEHRLEFDEGQSTAVDSEQVINVARIQERLSKRFQITGLDSPEQAGNLAMLLRAGALLAPVTMVEESVITPKRRDDQ